jgi:ribonuclease Z
LTFDPIAPKKYAFCSDTAYHEAILPIIKNVDVLYHETTFLQSEESLAKDITLHIQRSSYCIKANVKQLILDIQLDTKILIF